MIKINKKREENRYHLAADCESGTTLIDSDGHIWLCVLSDDKRENIWVHIDRHDGSAVLCDVDKPSEAYGKLCSIEITVLER